MSNNNPHEKVERDFIRFLYSLAPQDANKPPDRGALALLRKGLGKPLGTVIEMHPIVYSHLDDSISNWDEWRFFLVASLFALHYKNYIKLDKETTDSRSLGFSFRSLLSPDRGDQDKSLEKRFTRLLQSHREDIDYHLRQSIQLLKSHEIPVDYLQLLKDLKYWDHERRVVQSRWAKDLWTSSLKDKPETKLQGETHET